MRATPPDVEAGVHGRRSHVPRYPGSSVGIADPAVRVAFFALELRSRSQYADHCVRARRGGNEASAPLDRRVFPKPFAKSTIPVDDTFLQKVVPDIAGTSPGAGIATDDLLQAF